MKYASPAAPVLDAEINRRLVNMETKFESILPVRLVSDSPPDSWLSVSRPKSDV